MKHYQSEQRKGIEKGIKNTEWTEQDLAIKADTPLADAGTGKKIIIRVFDFKWAKGIKLQDMQRLISDKQTLFNAHANFIKSFLWKDGLSVLENQDPRLEFNKNGYRIAVACEARFGVSIFDKPTTLQQIMKPFSKKK